MKGQNLALAAVLFLLVGCSSSKKLEKPMASYEDYPASKVSVLNIPILIQLEELKNNLNRQLEGAVYEDKDMDDGDDMMLRASKSKKGEIDFTIDTNRIKYTVPLDLWVKYDAGFTYVEGEGEIALKMVTDLSIREDWSVDTKTKIITHEWLRKPKIRMAGMSLPVSALANLALRTGRRRITGQIDTLLRENIDLKTRMTELWKQMFQPLQVSPEYNTWLIVNPQSVGMTALESDAESVFSTVVVESQPQIKLGQKPDSLPPTPLPPFRFLEASNDTFQLNLNTQVTYREAERLAKAEMVGETFESGKRSVTVEDLEIYGKGDKLVVNTVLSGSYAGEVYLEGEPVYDRKKNRIEVKKMDYTLSTRNFLHKSAGWLLKSAIKNRIQESMDFYLDENLGAMEDQIRQQLNNYPLLEGVLLNGDLEDLQIRNVYLTSEAIVVYIGLAGKVNIRVAGLN